jgi:high affinity sulfate transporter 1
MSVPRAVRPMRYEWITRNVPGLVVLRTYQSRWLAKDVVAGLVLSALLVPQGMAYAELAGLPAVTGLYTSVLCLIGYAIFGPSKILVLGPDSSLGPMIAATILPLLGANGDPARAVALASMLALFTGAAMVLAGAGGLGFIADLLSRPTMLGYMNGLALTILVGQLPKLFGFSVDAHSFIGELAGFFSGVAAGEIVWAAAAVGIGALVLILVLQRYLPRLPAVLIAVVAAIIATIVFSLEAKGVRLVGVLPQGLPSLTIPRVGWSDVLPLIGGAFGIALVALADTISTASAFAERQGDEVDGNREMVGLGAANLAAGLFQGFPVSTSGSRTAVAEQSGSKTQVTGLVGAAVITVMLLFLPWLLQNLPQPTLAAVVIAASMSLADIPATRRLWSQSRSEFILSLTAFSGVVLLGVLLGIVVAITLSVANVFRRTWWPYQATLGRRPGIAGYHDVARHPEAEQLEGCTIFRFDAPLIFANARTFRDQVLALAKASPRPAWIIVAAEPLTDVDTTACDMLEDLVTDLDQQGVTLVFAEMKGPVKEKARQFGLDATIPDDRFFPTLGTAVKAWRAASSRSEGVDDDRDR